MCIRDRLRISGENTVSITNVAGTESYARFVKDGTVELYYDGSKKFETTSTGATVTGKLDFTGSGHLNGVNLGASQQLNLYHDASDAYFDNNVGDFYIRNDGNSTSEQIKIQAKGGESSIIAKPNGSVELYYDNSKKFETISNGVSVTDRLGIGTTSPTDALHVVGTSLLTSNTYVQGNFYCLSDSKKIMAGASNDARMYHDGQDSYFDSLTGTLYLYNHVSNRGITFGTNSQNRCQISDLGHFIPAANNTYDIGTSSYRWRNIYTNDLNLSNEGSSNDVDGTWGDWTIQEGESDLFLKNNRSGKKYKFNLTEVS